MSRHRITFSSPDRVVSDPPLSDDAARYFADMFQVTRRVARAALRTAAWVSAGAPEAPRARLRIWL